MIVVYFRPKYKLKNKTQTGDRIELTIEVKIKNNDVSYVSRFNAIDGVESVTTLYRII